MILAKPPPPKESSKEEWWAGKFLGLPEPEPGEWYPGKRLGIKRKSAASIEDKAPVEPLVWKNVSQLTADLSHTQHIEGVVAVLEICCTIVDDDMTLAVATLNAVIRLGTGRLDRALKFGDGGSCEYVVKLLHWYMYSRIDVLAGEISEHDRASCNDLVESCLASALGAVEVLAAGCKPNRERLGKAGACSYVVEAFRMYGRPGKSPYLAELCFNCMWQLSFGNSFNRARLREAGAENELWAMSRSTSALPAQRNRAQAVLGWLKSQLADDLTSSREPREVAGGLLLSISEITNASAKGSPTEAVKLASEGFFAVVRLCSCSDSLSVVEEFVDGIGAAEVLVKVTRRVLRHHRKIFRDDIEKLCRFISSSCEAMCCLLSGPYRLLKKGADGDDVEQIPKGDEASFEGSESIYSGEAVSKADSDRDDDVESDGVDPGPAFHPHKELTLTKNAAQQMISTGACRMLVKELELYVDPESSHYEKPSKHTHIMLQSSSVLDLDPISLLTSGTGVITKGMIAGFHGMKSGINKINSSIQSSVMKVAMFPDTPEGNCLSSICQAIRILAEVSIEARLKFVEEELNDTCRLLSRGVYETGVKDLQMWFLEFLNYDLSQDYGDGEDGIVALKLALRVIYSFGGNPSKPYSPMDDRMKLVFSESLNCIARYVSEQGAEGESLFAERNGYHTIFLPINKTLLADYKIVDAWVNAVTSIALARVEAKNTLGRYGACEICLDSLRLHALRPHVVQRCLWAICVLAANHAENMDRVLKWSSDSWNADTAKSLLLTVQKSKGQTNEARDHASLILSWMELRSMMPSKASRKPDEKSSESIFSFASLDRMISGSSTASDRGPLHSECEASVQSIPAFSTPPPHNSNDALRTEDIFFSFVLRGLERYCSGRDVGATEV